MQGNLSQPGLYTNTITITVTITVTTIITSITIITIIVINILTITVSSRRGPAARRAGHLPRHRRRGPQRGAGPRKETRYKSEHDKR